jgi:hypothetical protein
MVNGLFATVTAPLHRIRSGPKMLLSVRLWNSHCSGRKGSALAMQEDVVSDGDRLKLPCWINAESRGNPNEQ